MRRYPDRASWSIEESRSPELTFALHVRDAGGLSQATQSLCPALSPEVATYPPLHQLVGPNTAYAWNTWWKTAASDTKPTAYDLTSVTGEARHYGTDLAELVSADYRAAEAWIAQRETEEEADQFLQEGLPPAVNLRDIVLESAAEAGVLKPVFLLQVRILPVAGPWSQSPAPGRLLVSRETRHNAEDYASALRSALRGMNLEQSIH